MGEVSFDMWMSSVDRILSDVVGLSSGDLVDVAYYDLYDSGFSPAEAAQEALIESGAAEEVVDLILV